MLNRTEPSLAGVEPTAPVAFLSPQPSDRPEVSTSHDCLRGRLCRFNMSWFDAPTEVLQMNLFPDASFDVAVDRRSRVLGAEVVNAHSIHATTARAILVRKAGAVAGRIRVPDGSVYSIKTAGQGLCWVQEVDEQRPGTAPGYASECRDPTTPTLAALHAGVTIQAVSVEAPLVVMDLMLLYTTELLGDWGGRESAEAELALCAAYLNQVLEQSRAPARVRLVHTAEITEAVIPASAWHRKNRLLQELMSNPWVKARQQACGADVVSLATTAELDGGGCAHCNYANNPDARAFSVFAENAVFFAHEVGHNLGCRHHAMSDPDCINYGYNNGYRFLAENRWYVTLMNRGSGASGVGCDFFSNPELLFRGAAAGTEAANNVRRIAEVAPLIAAGWDPPPFPFLEMTCAPDRSEVRLEVLGAWGCRCQLECTSDFVTWDALETLTIGVDGTRFAYGVEGSKRLFFRVSTKE